MKETIIKKLWEATLLKQKCTLNIHFPNTDKTICSTYHDHSDQRNAYLDKFSNNHAFEEKIITVKRLDSQYDGAVLLTLYIKNMMDSSTKITYTEEKDYTILIINDIIKLIF